MLGGGGGGGGEAPLVQLWSLTSDSHKTWHDYTTG